MTDPGPEEPRGGESTDPIHRRRSARGSGADPGDSDSTRQEAAASVLAALQASPPEPEGETGRSTPSGADEASAAPVAFVPADDPAWTESPGEARDRLHREAAAREAAERSQLAREQRTRAAARRAALGDARRLEEEEVARAKGERAERWRREQQEIARAAAGKAAEKKEARAEARRRRRAAARAEKAARKAAADAERERERRQPHAGPAAPRTARPTPAEASRTSPSAAEIAALTTQPQVPEVPPEVPRPVPAAAPATGPDRRSYAERYGDLTPASKGDGREVVRPRTGVHRAVTVLLLATLAACGVFGYAAWIEPTTANVGLAAVCAAAALVVWAARASAAPVRVVIDHGTMDVVHRGTRHRFDLTSQYTRVQMVGRPGRLGWAVRLTRGDAAPLVLKASAVRSRELSAALRQWRPEL